MELNMLMTAPAHPPLEHVTKPFLTTEELAHYTNTAPQTWRIRSCKGTGPLAPIKIPGTNRLNWPTGAVRKMLGVTA